MFGWVSVWVENNRLKRQLASAQDDARHYKHEAAKWRGRATGRPLRTDVELVDDQDDRYQERA